ncbi:MAG: hypothetical protein O2816_04645, partial [Planctomycetota bacterium]|nr:hypothetical protein [Planctomycetota bacterium]
MPHTALVRAIPILLAGLAGCMSVPDPDEGWVLLEEKGGIAISARGLEDADFPRLRGVAVLDADPLEVIAVFSDVNRSAEWVPNLVEARYLAPPSNEATWVYQRGRAPIPAHLIVWDRDVVMFTELIPIEEGRSWRAEFLAGEPDRVDVPTKVVRMPHMAGHAYLERSEDGRTRIEFEVELDAGGS